MCDCSICKRKSALMVKVHESRFRLLAGEEALTEYRFHTKTARHFFRKVCGIYPFHRKRVTPDNLGINVDCVDGFDPAGVPSMRDNRSHTQKRGETMAASIQRAGPWRPAARMASVLLTLAAAAAPAAAQTLFDGRAAGPLSQGWLPLQQGTPAVTGQEAEGFRFNTLADRETQQGYFLFSPLALDDEAGFELLFDLQIDGATSTSANRGGFSLLLVGDDPARSLELVFDQGVVYSYDYLAGDADRFVRGPSAALAMGEMHSFALQVADGGYTLQIDGAQQLAGSLADYRAQGLPYTLGNFIFFGDNTSRAASNVLIGGVAIAPVPEPGTLALWLAGAGLLALRERGSGRRAG